MKRIFLAFLMSFVGIALSWHFLRPREWTSNVTQREVVARVLSLKNDVSRQENGRLLWSPIRQGDEIYLNDKIKTSGLSSIVIQLIDSSSKLEIEENSMIVMAKGERKLALDMLEGRVFIEQQEENVDLLSGGKKLDVSGNAAVSVSKSGESQVHSFNSAHSSLFSELTPSYSAEVMTAAPQIEVTWKKTEAHGPVEVFMGESPLLLKKVEGVGSDLATGTLKVPMRPGTNYWQLASGDTKSPLMKLDLIRPLAPTPVYPADKELVKTEQRPFDFKWVKGNTTGAVQIEVAKDASFKQMYISEEVTNQTFFTPSAVLPPGEYFWKLKTKLEDGTALDSKTSSFIVHLGTNFLSPTPIYPADHAIIYLGKTPSNNVRFEWKKQDTAETYQLVIEGEGMKKKARTVETNALVSISKTGTYSWEVTSEGKSGEQSVLPVTRTFDVREFSHVAWIMPQKNFFYLDSLPIIILKWEKKLPGISRLKISETQDFKETESFDVNGRDFPYRVQKDGIYFAKVSILDETGEVAADSDAFEFTVKEAPLPPAPLISGGGKKLIATPQGEIRARIENAKPNWLIIASVSDARGQVVDERKFNDEVMSFSGLMPGKYALRAKFQDEYRRTGETSDRLEIEVPQKSQIRAPKIKGIKVR